MKPIIKARFETIMETSNEGANQIHSRFMRKWSENRPKTTPKLFSVLVSLGRKKFKGLKPMRPWKPELRYRDQAYVSVKMAKRIRPGLPGLAGASRNSRKGDP